ncbi:MAG: hypothetical protein ACRERV_18290, partial [Methylococcales bacterium]
MRNIQQLITPQGAFIVLHAELRSQWVDIVFGLTEGWWRFKDLDLRPDYPLIKRQQWRQVLSDCGFINTVFTGDLAEVHADSPQLIFLAQAAKEEIGERDDRLARPTDDNPASVHWLIFADRQGTAAALQDYLAQHRYAATLLLPGEDSRTIADGVWSIKPGDKAQLDQACRSILTSKRFNIVHLWSLDSEPLDSDGYPAMLKANSVASHTILYLIQCLDEIGIKEQLERLILVTRGAQALELDREGVNVVQSPLIGLARVVQDEHPELNCCAVDLDPRAQDFNALFAELFNQDGENEVAYRYRQRFAPRLRKAERPLQWQDNCRSSAAPSFR